MGAAIAANNMGGKAPAAPAPVDAAKASGEYLFGKSFGNYQGVTDPALQAKLIEAERVNRPQYAALDLADINTYLLGTGGQKGVIGLTEQATRSAAGLDREAQAMQRQQDIESLTKYGAQTTEALRNADPNSLAIAQAQQKYAASAMESAGQPLSDPNVAMQQQLAKSAYGSAGQPSTNVNLGLQQQLANKAYGSAGQTSTDINLGLQQQLAKSAYGSAGQASTDVNLGLQQQLANQSYARAGQESTDPIYAAQLKLAQDAYGRTGTLGFEDQRRADQQALLLGQQAGRVGGSGVIAAQMLNRQAAQDQRSLMAQQAGQQAFGMGANLYGRDVQNRQMAQQAGANAFGMGADLYGRDVQNRQFAQQAGQQAFGMGVDLYGRDVQNLQMAQQAGTGAFGMGADLYGRDLQNRQFAQQAGGAAMQFGDVLSQRQAQAIQSAQQAGQQAFGYNRALSGDIANVILGRPSNAAAMGSQFFGQAGQMSQSQGPKLFDPNAGVNLALQNSSNQSNYQASIFGAKSAMKGAIIGGALGGAGAAAGGLCWVAREVYGFENPSWVVFREWLLGDSPKWFLDLYAKHGEKFALFIKNKPSLKKAIKWWMDGRVATYLSK